ncbi:MAG TPA: condensation domain-containing protein, partial [Pilimelia sp.]|nr:condensation domain-containing protein [Pilimelia sp.]
LPEYMVPSAVLVLDALPLTGHGKVDRAALPRPDAPRPAGSTPATPAEHALCAAFAAVLGLDRVGADASFFALGGDSIGAIQVVSHARRAGLRLTTRDVFRHPTVAALAAAAGAVDAPDPRPADDGVGEVPLLPIVHRLREELADRPAALAGYAQYVTVRAPAGLTGADLAPVLQAVLDRHDSLRLRLGEPAPGVWSLTALPAGAVRAADLIQVAGPDADPAALLAGARARLRPADGVVLQAVLVPGAGDAPGRLLLVGHHLAVDGVSWRILLADLAAAGAGVAVDPVGTSYRRWAARLRDEAGSAARTAELPAWTADPLPGPLTPGRPDPARDTRGAARTVRVSLPAADTAALLTALPEVYGAEVTEILLTALALAVADRRRAGGAAGGVAVDVERHGREPFTDDVDLSRTVGWFTTVHPVVLDSGPRAGQWPAAGDAVLAAALKRVKEQVRALPGRGLGYGLLRHLNAQTAPLLACRPEPGLLFNYLGRFPVDQGDAWSLLGDAAGLTTTPDTPLRYPAEVLALVEDRPTGPVLTTTWTLAPGLFTADEARDLAESFQRALAALAAHAAVPGAGGRTPSDFPLVRVSQEEIEAFEAEPGGLADLLPLSPLQKGLLFQAHYDPTATDAYTLQVVLDLDGPVDPAALRAAAVALVDRNPALRSCFRYRASGEPVQVVRSRVDVPFEVVDLTGAEADGAVEARRRTDADWLRRFDVAGGPLIRFAVYRTAERRYRVVWTAHHLLVDGWSLSSVLGRELLALWGGACPAELPPAARPHGYLAWAGRQDAGAARAAWAAELAGLAGGTHLGPPQRPRADGLPAELWRTVPAGLSAAVARWARARGLTPNTVYQGAWAILLGRLTGRRDVTFGAVHSGRPADLPDVDRMVGAFMQTVPVRVQLAPDRPVEELLADLHARQARLEPHHHLGLAEIQRVAGGGELFDTVLSYHNYPAGDLDDLGAVVPGLRTLGWQARVIAEYPLAVGVYPAAETRLHAQYRPDVLPADAVADALDRYVRVLDALVTTAGARPCDIDALAPAERATILGEWAGAATAAGGGPDVAAIVARHAADRPNAVAVVHGAATVDYATLAARVDRLAAVLAADGVRPESRVAVLLPRSVDFVVAVLAVLRSGGAFVPVDVGQPADRIGHLLADAGAATVLTNAAVAAGPVRAHLGTAAVLRLDTPTVAARLAAAAPAAHPPVRPEHAAYVIYTSGSTGRPKGVVVEQRGLLAMVDSLVDRFGLDADSRVLQFASVGFDASVWEIGLALLTGGRLVLADDGERTDAAALAALIHRAGVNLAGLPPAVVADLPPEAALPPGLRLAVAGEACPPAVAARWASRVRLFNGY